MKTLLLSTSTALIAFISSPAMAASKIVSINDLAITSGRFTIQVPDGSGVVLDLSEVNQTVKGANFGDATKFVISGIDGQLCYMQKDKCEATGASVISLKPVKGVEISTQSHSPDGSTTLTLITSGKLGTKVLHMLLIPTIKAPYTAIVARKDFAPAQSVVASKIEGFQLEPNKVHVSKLPNVDGSTTSKLSREHLNSKQPQVQVESGLGNEKLESPASVVILKSKQSTPLPLLGTANGSRTWSEPVSADEHRENEKPNSLAVNSTSPAPFLSTTYEQSPNAHFPGTSQQLATASTAEGQPLFPSNNIKPYQAEANVTTVLPDLEKALPSAPPKPLPSDSVRVNPKSALATPGDPLSLSFSESNSVSDGYAVALGLLVAKKIGWIKPQTIIWNEAQKAVAGLLQGKTKIEASNEARIKLQDLDQLLAWGQSAVALLRQGQNLASIADIVQANVVHDAERALLLKQLFELKNSNL